MSTPNSVRTADGVEISVDRIDAGRLQFAVSDRREGRAAWNLTTDLTTAEVAELHGYLGDWLAEFAPPGDGQVTVRADDLRALLSAADTDYLSTENLPDLEERISRLEDAAGLNDDDGLEWDDDRDGKDMDPHYCDGADE